MSGELRALWEWGFEFGGRRHRWGTVGSELPEMHLRGGQQHGLPTIHRSAFAARAGPVTSVLLQIAAEARLFEDDELEALRSRLDADLGPGLHEASEHGPEKASSRWRIGGADVLLAAYPSDWAVTGGRSSGCLQIVVDLERVAGPYLPRAQAEGEAWARGPGEVEIVPAPRLRDHREPPWSRDHLSLALGWPALRVTPGWIAGRLAPGQVALWHHAPSATRGISVPAFTLPFDERDPPALRHVRWARARGPGLAEILDADGEGLLITMPGPDGLDAVAARLAELGVPVERVEETDWG